MPRGGRTRGVFLSIGNQVYFDSEKSMSLGTFWIIASFSFVVAMSGALVPGPLLTYTIMKTLETKRRGAMVGALVIVGHAILESFLVIALLAGFASLLKNQLTIRIIGTVGGAVLVFFGGRLMYDLIRGKVRDVFLNSQKSENSENPPDAAMRALPHPIIGGILVSMSNPYWWVWWGSIGLAFMTQYDVSFRNPARLLSFMAGHEAGDLAVYWMVSVLVAIGRTRINERAYRIVLFFCAALMVGFGLFLGIKPNI